MDSSTVKNVSESLRARGLTMACAESCTGGLVAKLVTDLAGSSEIFEGGVVSYSNDVKMKILGVSESTLAAHGAVSEQTAEEMARGVTERLGSDIAEILSEAAGTPDVGVVIAGSHSCMTARGIRNVPARTITQTFLGKFRNDADLRNMLTEGVR